MNHAKEAFGRLIVSGRDCTVDLEMTAYAFDAVPLLAERPSYSMFTRRLECPGITGSIFRAARLARIASAS